MGWTASFSKPEGVIGRIILADMNIGHTPLSKWGLKHYAWQPDTAALDIGCGGGANLKRMLRLAPEGTVCGIDISNESVIKSKRVNLRELGRRCTVKHGSADKIPFKAESFDVATAFETVYFWHELPKAFAEVMRVLKCGGTFLIVCEESDPDTIWTKLVEGMRAYSPQQLEEYMIDAGFVDVKTDCNKLLGVCVTGKKPE